MNIPDARLASDQVSAGRETGLAFNKVLIDAISTSIGAQSNTATVSFSGKAGADVMRTLQELKQKGYRVTQSGTNMTVTW